MADNPTVAAQVAGQTTTIVVAADDVASALYQYVKLAFGADGTATLVSSTNPLPTVETSKSTALNEGSVISASSSAGGTQVLAANSTRVQATVIPESDCYMSFGTVSSSSAKLGAFQPFNVPAGYKGAMTMQGVSGAVNVHVWDI